MSAHAALDRPVKLKSSRLKVVGSIDREFEPIKLEAEKASATFTLAGSKSQIDVPSEMVPVIVEILEQLLAGNAVTVAPINTELTTQQAADLLNVSRPHIVKLIENKKIPSTKVGTHRRVRLDDLLTYRDKDDAVRRKVADKLAAELDAMGLGY